MQTPTRFITFFILAVILVGTLSIIGILVVRNRPVPTANASDAAQNGGNIVSYTVDINGNSIAIRQRQGQELSLVQQPPTAVPPPTVEEILPTATPEAVAQEPTIVPIQPTAVPEATAQPDAGTGGQVQPQGGGAGINPAVPPLNDLAYTVQAGNTLYSLARNNNTTIELMAAHGISSANLIPGHVINIPVPNPAYCLNSRPYVVHEGDTAFSLARNNGLTLEQFRVMNNLDASYALSLGQVICLP